VALLGGLLGAVALGALAGARRTVSAYGRYLAAIDASDAFVNIPGRAPGIPLTRPMTLISRLPGVAAGAAYIGMDANPVVHGHIDVSFLTDSLVGTYSGPSFSADGFGQDRLTVLAGRLPAPGATSEIVLTPRIADLFGVGVGGRVTYQLYRQNPETFQTYPVRRATFLVTGIADIPPVLVDQSDQKNGGVLPPGTTQRLLAAYEFAWVGVRLDRGTAGIPALQHELAALAMLVLVGQGMAQMLSRSAPAISAVRALGATRAQAALAVGLPAVIATLGGMILAVAGAILLSPLAPVGPVRQFDPARGLEADGLVLGAGSALLTVILAGLLAAMAGRAVRRSARRDERRPSVIARAAASAGLPAYAVLGSRNALQPGSSQQAVPARAALIGSITAVTAVTVVAVFGASLTGLITHPIRYGWNWNVLIQAEGGYGNWSAATMNRLVDGQPAVAGWLAGWLVQLRVRPASCRWHRDSRARPAAQPRLGPATHHQRP
jgi:hypothetical protein